MQEEEGEMGTLGGEVVDLGIGGVCGVLGFVWDWWVVGVEKGGGVV